MWYSPSWKAYGILKRGFVNTSQDYFIAITTTTCVSTLMSVT
jgi:hypothetical protein